jgi:TolA-binding protein
MQFKAIQNISHTILVAGLFEVLSMKYLSIILLLLFSFSTSVFAADNRQSETDSIIVKKESQSVFKGLLYKVWGRLRALNPKLETHSRKTVATMGVRGAETTTSLIEPYWKGDKTDDQEYVIELTRYTKAQQYAEDGDLQKAITALSEFLNDYESSELKPNAQFALGLSQGGLGDISASKKTLRKFVEDNPKHPLVADARQVIAELN